MSINMVDCDSCTHFYLILVNRSGTLSIYDIKYDIIRWLI